MPNTPPPEVIALLKEREGVKYESYLDSLGYPTGGCGHLLTLAERAQYPIGTAISEDVVNQWLENDSSNAYNAAAQQAAEIGCSDQHLIDALTSIIFQMGSAWNRPEIEGGKGFVHTWQLLREHLWSEAAAEAEHSAWATETPVRYQDFRAALLAIAE